MPLLPSDIFKDHLNVDKRKYKQAPGWQSWGPSNEDEDGQAGPTRKMPVGQLPFPLCPFDLCALGQIT